MYEALLLVSFGGPEKPEDVLPFLENVTRGRNIPHERLLGVAEHYYHFGGKSPINDQNRELISVLRNELEAQGVALPIYWGNRNWQPTIADALRQMRDDGIHKALALMTSAYSSYSGCRQYRENVAAAQAEIGEGAPEIHKLRVFYNHPGFIEACADRVQGALAAFTERTPRLVFTAHSIPMSMAESSAYEHQLRETARLVALAVNLPDWDLVYQSRSGAPNQPWLEPDILDHLKNLAAQGSKAALIAPIGFISDHMEVLYDLDTEAKELAQELRIELVRAPTAGTHPAFVRGLAQLIRERLDPAAPKLAVGRYGPNHDVCPADCCPAPARAGRPLVLTTSELSRQP